MGNGDAEDAVGSRGPRRLDSHLHNRECLVVVTDDAAADERLLVLGYEPAAKAMARN